jgi:hypothetical protein
LDAGARAGCPSRRRHPTSPGRAEDAYVAGYATAVLDCELDVKGSKITVKDGVVTVGVAGCRGVTTAVC